MSSHLICPWFLKLDRIDWFNWLNHWLVLNPTWFSLKTRKRKYHLTLHIIFIFICVMLIWLSILFFLILFGMKTNLKLFICFIQLFLLNIISNYLLYIFFICFYNYMIIYLFMKSPVRSLVRLQFDYKTETILFLFSDSLCSSIFKTMNMHQCIVGEN